TGDAQAGSRSAFIIPLTAGNWARRDPREGRRAPRDESRCRETREETLGSANLSTKRQPIAELARTKAGTSSPPCVSRQTSHGRRPLRQRERNSPVKNRMRESCTSGSARGGDGDIPTYSALGAAQRREGGVEGALVGERGEVAEEGEAAGRMQDCEAVEEQATEQARQHAHGQEEAGLAGDPARTVRRQAAAGHDDVDVRMVGERRAPGVQHGGEADARAEMLRVGGDRGQRLGGGPEQEVVDGGLVLERDGADRGRQ